jgi:hypothetical protein
MMATQLMAVAVQRHAHAAAITLNDLPAGIALEVGCIPPAIEKQQALTAVVEIAFEEIGEMFRQSARGDDIATPQVHDLDARKRVCTYSGR